VVGVYGEPALAALGAVDRGPPQGVEEGPFAQVGHPESVGELRGQASRHEVKPLVVAVCVGIVLSEQNVLVAVLLPEGAVQVAGLKPTVEAQALPESSLGATVSRLEPHKPCLPLENLLQVDEVALAVAPVLLLLLVNQPKLGTE
jgi:hypothetical protein